MASQEDLSRKVERFCRSAHERDYGLATSKVEDKLDELCGELRICASSIGDERSGEWERKLDAIGSAYEACDQAGGIRSLCNPFFDRAEGLIEECHRR